MQKSQAIKYDLNRAHDPDSAPEVFGEASELITTYHPETDFSITAPVANDRRTKLTGTEPTTWATVGFIGDAQESLCDNMDDGSKDDLAGIGDDDFVAEPPPEVIPNDTSSVTPMTAMRQQARFITTSNDDVVEAIQERAEEVLGGYALAADMARRALRKIADSLAEVANKVISRKAEKTAKAGKPVAGYGRGYVRSVMGPQRSKIYRLRAEQGAMTNIGELPLAPTRGGQPTFELDQID